VEGGKVFSIREMCEEDKKTERGAEEMDKFREGKQREM
jgi:hypothetical protein